MTTDPQQQQMIRDAMKAIAERRPGRSKLVYDKTKRTIVAVAEGTQTPRALNITADDADMFAIVTLSSKWLREHWSDVLHGSGISVDFISWDDGDALVQVDLSLHSTRDRVVGTLRLGEEEGPGNDDALSTASNSLGRAATASSSTFSASDGPLFQATGWRRNNQKKETVGVAFADVEPELAT